jgi:hypothetical protein
MCKTKKMQDDKLDSTSVVYSSEAFFEITRRWHSTNLSKEAFCKFACLKSGISKHGAIFCVGIKSNVIKPQSEEKFTGFLPETWVTESPESTSC